MEPLIGLDREGSGEIFDGGFDGKGGDERFASGRASETPQEEP